MRVCGGGSGWVGFPRHFVEQPIPLTLSRRCEVVERERDGFPQSTLVCPHISLVTELGSDAGHSLKHAQKKTRRLQHLVI